MSDEDLKEKVRGEGRRGEWRSRLHYTWACIADVYRLCLCVSLCFPSLITSLHTNLKYMRIKEFLKGFAAIFSTMFSIILNITCVDRRLYGTGEATDHKAN
jgi:hypothetical protein